MNTNKDYHPEKYWSEIAQRILFREDKNVIAGDDEPFYRYKRRKFAQLLTTLNFVNKKVFELGCGPGGNLNIVSKRNPLRLVGVDISQKMIDLAKKNTTGIELYKVDGEILPFKDQEFDLSFSATVLQHNTDEQMLKNILSELCRVTNKELVLFERVEKSMIGDELCVGRPVDYYKSLCEIKGFNLKEVEFINVNISYYICGAIRKVLNPRTRKEGEPLNDFSIFLQKFFLFFTKPLDKIFPANRDLAKMVFYRIR